MKAQGTPDSPCFPWCPQGRRHGHRYQETVLEGCSRHGDTKWGKEEAEVLEKPADIINLPRPGCPVKSRAHGFN